MTKGFLKAGTLKKTALAVLLFAVVAGAGYLRLHRLDEVPAGFFRDEAVNGYEAYCLLVAGHDSYGKIFPLHLRAFDDYREPLFHWSLAALMHFAGVSEWTVRAAAALWGTATVAALFFLGARLFGRGVGLGAAALLALMPWHVYASRFGVRMICAPFFLVLMVWAFDKWVGSRRTRYLLVSTVGCAAGYYTYTPFELFSPLLAAALALSYARRLTGRMWIHFAGALGVFALLVAPAVYEGFFSEALTRFGNIGLFSKAREPADALRIFLKNYWAHVRTQFLFEPGHGLRLLPNDVPLLPRAMGPLLILFFARLAARREARDFAVFFWLALSPVAASLTVQGIPNPPRALMMPAALALASASGLGFACRAIWDAGNRLKAGWGRYAGGILATVMVLAFAADVQQTTKKFLRRYFGLFAVTSANRMQYGFRDVMMFVEENEPHYRRVVFDAPFNNDYYRKPMAFFLFYVRPDPAYIVEAREFFETDGDQYTKFLDKFYVDVKRNPAKDLVPGSLLVGRPEKNYREIVPELVLAGKIMRPDGQPAFALYEWPEEKKTR